MMTSVPCTGSSALSRLRKLAGDTRAFALTEFAYGLPIMLSMGAYGIEIANYAIVHLRVSQIALSLADNASRVGLNNGLSSQQMREVDVNDILQGARLQGTGIDIATHGRITLSSLENVQQSWDATPVQRIHWQRCLGLKSGTEYDSSFGTTTSAAGTTNTASDQGTDAPNGMGETGAQVVAPENSAVMFVEVNYEYQPLFGSMLMARTRMHYIASFIVRDKRDFTKVYNPAPNAARATCNLHAS